MGLSRNKVSLRERGDGSPPFYGERGKKNFPYEKNKDLSKLWLKLEILFSLQIPMVSGEHRFLKTRYMMKRIRKNKNMFFLERSEKIKKI